MTLSDQIRSIADTLPAIDRARLQMVALAVRRMEVTLDEMVAESMAEAIAPPAIPAFPSHSRRH